MRLERQVDNFNNHMMPLVRQVVIHKLSLVRIVCLVPWRVPHSRIDLNTRLAGATLASKKVAHGDVEHPEGLLTSGCQYLLSDALERQRKAHADIPDLRCFRGSIYGS